MLRELCCKQWKSRSLLGRCVIFRDDRCSEGCAEILWSLMSGPQLQWCVASEDWMRSSLLSGSVSFISVDKGTWGGKVTTTTIPKLIGWWHTSINAHRRFHMLLVQSRVSQDLILSNLANWLAVEAHVLLLLLALVRKTRHWIDLPRDHYNDYLHSIHHLAGWMELYCWIRSHLRHS